MKTLMGIFIALIFCSVSWADDADRLLIKPMVHFDQVSSAASSLGVRGSSVDQNINRTVGAAIHGESSRKEAMNRGRMKNDSHEDVAGSDEGALWVLLGMGLGLVYGSLVSTGWGLVIGALIGMAVGLIWSRIRQR